MIKYHSDKMYIVLVLALDEKSGQLGYRSKHFDIKTFFLHEMRNTGKTVVINYDTLCVQFKRGCDIESDSKNLKGSRDIPNVLTISSTPPDSELHVPDSDLPVPDSNIIELNKLLPDVISALKLWLKLYKASRHFHTSVIHNSMRIRVIERLL